MADLASIRTKVRNTSGGDMFFGFLGKHGKLLEDNEYYSFVGDLKTLVAGNSRTEAALNAALEGENLVIITDPLAVHLDATTDNVQHGVIDNSVLTVAHPDWGEYDIVTGHA